MKRVVTIFNRDTYISQSDGSAKTYFHDMSLCKPLGNTAWLRVQLYGYRASSNNVRVRIQAWSTSVNNGRRPSEIGVQIGSDYIFDTLRPDPFLIHGPYDGLLELLLIIEDSTASSEEDMDLEVGVTLSAG